MDRITYEELDIGNMHLKFKPFESLCKNLTDAIDNFNMEFFEITQDEILEIVNMARLLKQFELKVDFQNFLHDLLDDFKEGFDKMELTKKS